MSPTRAPGLPPADPLADEAALAGWDDLTDEELRALMPDPGGSPPEDAAGAWLAGLLTGDASLPDDAGLMPADRGLSPGAQEAGAGEPAATWLESLFPHCTPDGPGLSASAVPGVLAPGVALAGFTVDASGRLAQISESELIGVLRAWRRLNSWTAAGELAVVAELARRRDAQVAAGADPRLAEHASDELAAALTLTARGADLLLDFATCLSRLPLTRAALAEGRIDRARALVICEETRGLGDQHAAAVDAEVSRGAPGQTTGQLRAAVRRAVLAADPAAARRRKQQAQQDARVEKWDEPAGTAALAGRDLPPAQVLAADHNLTALAQQLRTAGVPGTMDQLRAHVFLALLAGEPLTGLTGAGLPSGGGLLSGAGVPSGAGLPSEMGIGQPPGSHVPGTPGRTGRTRDSLIPSAGSSLPDGMAGTGTGPDALAGTTAGQQTRGPDTPWPGAPPGAGAASGLRGSVNLTMPLTSLLGTSGQPGEVPGFGPLDAADCRELASQLARWDGNRWCITFTDDHGHPVAHGCTRIRRRLGSGGKAPPPGGEWTFTIQTLPAATCQHPLQTTAYRPPSLARHLVQVRHPACTFPGCRHPATRCDLDHTVPYDQGGRTCSCNLAPLCRRHHRAKQVQGWQLEQPRPGVLVWRLPHGRAYVTGPAVYRH